MLDMRSIILGGGAKSAIDEIKAMMKRLAGILTMVTVAALCDIVAAQNYPHKPIRIVTSEVGGSLDFSARIVAQGLTGALGQSVIVENRGGASGAIMAQMVARASPDGYTLLFYGSALWILPLLQATPYDAIKDFAPITAAIRSPTILVVHPSLQVASVKDLIALAKSKPGGYNYASSATGGSAHLAAELFKSMAGVNMVRISYKGNGPAVNDLIAGQVHLMFSSAAGVMPHVKSGKVKALAVTSAQPSELLPALPTVAATGLPGFEASTVYSIFAPARTPAPLVTRLNREIVQLLLRADAKERFFNAGVEPVGSTPDQLAATIKSEVASLGKVIKEAGIRAE